MSDEYKGRYVIIALVKTPPRSYTDNAINTTKQLLLFLKKNQTTPRPSEHPPVMGEKMSKRLGGIKRLQIQNRYMAFKQVPRCR